MRLGNFAVHQLNGAVTAGCHTRVVCGDNKSGALLKQVGIDYSKSLVALKAYNGLTHRCQVVADKREIKWVNDSKATNVASTLAALSGLEYQGTLYLLVGGVGKGADFSELKPVLAQLDRVQLCCFGEDAVQFMPLHSSAQKFETMQQIIEYYICF